MDGAEKHIGWVMGALMAILSAAAWLVRGGRKIDAVERAVGRVDEIADRVRNLEEANRDREHTIANMRQWQDSHEARQSATEVRLFERLDAMSATMGRIDGRVEALLNSKGAGHG